jgi:hypothetical protein
MEFDRLLVFCSGFLDLQSRSRAMTNIEHQDGVHSFPAAMQAHRVATSELGGDEWTRAY